MDCIWSSWCHCHPIISCFNIKFQNGSCWCQLTQTVLENRPLNGCSHSSVVLLLERTELSVCIGHDCELCKNGWSKWDAIWVVYSGRPKKLQIRWGIWIQKWNILGDKCPLCWPTVKCSDYVAVVWMQNTSLTKWIKSTGWFSPSCHQCYNFHSVLLTPCVWQIKWQIKGHLTCKICPIIHTFATHLSWSSIIFHRLPLSENYERNHFWKEGTATLVYFSSLMRCLLARWKRLVLLIVAGAKERRSCAVWWSLLIICPIAHNTRNRYRLAHWHWRCHGSNAVKGSAASPASQGGHFIWLGGRPASWLPITGLCCPPTCYWAVRHPHCMDRCRPHRQLSECPLIDIVTRQYVLYTGYPVLNWINSVNISRQ